LLNVLLGGINLPNIGGAPLAVLLPKPLDNLSLEGLIRCAVLNDLKIASKAKSISARVARSDCNRGARPGEYIRASPIEG
jgi:hypothetical protein